MEISLAKQSVWTYGHTRKFLASLGYAVDETAGGVFDVNNQSLRLYGVGDIDAQGRYVIDEVPNDSLRFRSEESTWKLKLGVRYSF